MAVRIAEIKVESVGPLHSFTMTPAALNLIYGHNECGKTYLVEFLIRSLFKNTSSWELRDIAAERGQVQVAGLGKEPVPFTLAGKKRKLEDYLHDANPNLPVNLPRLLVVRGADLEIVHGDSRISDRTVLRDYLSGAETLDGIERNIKPTVRNATIGNGTIVASRTGEVKEREQALERIKTADNLLARINSDFSGGQAGLLNAQVAAVRVRLPARNAPNASMRTRCRRRSSSWRRKGTPCQNLNWTA